MIKYTLILVLLLSGCGTTSVPLSQKFPNAPPELMKNCENLNTLQDSNKISDLLKVVVENYKLYYECANRVDGWKTWHSTQKEIFENTSKK